MTYCSVATVLGLVGLTKKHFGHYHKIHEIFLTNCLFLS